MTVALRGRILHFLTSAPVSYDYYEDGVLYIVDGKVVDVGDASRFASQGFDLEQCEHRPGQLILPGFIDTHVHSPQIDIIGSFGEQLLDWLNKYTFPAEARYADEAYARASADIFVDALLGAGTTSAMVFATSHLSATNSLFEAAHTRDMRLIAGKVMMDQNAMPELLDTADSSDRDSRHLINAWHGKGRLGYAVTPRFAGSSSAIQLGVAGQLHQDFPDTWVQTHLSENLDEIRWVAEVHPDSRDYLDAYEKYGLHTDRSVFAHCLHLTDDEYRRMADTGGVVAFCPTSNLFLGSGLLNLDRFRQYDIPVSLATDVGAGTTLSMLRTMGEAYKVCQMRGYSLGAGEAFSMATLGNAECLHLERYIGNFEPGKEGDCIVLDASSAPLLARRLGYARSIEEELFVLMTMGDDTLIAETWVAGVCQYKKAGQSLPDLGSDLLITKSITKNITKNTLEG